MEVGGGHWGTVNTATPQQKIAYTASPQKKQLAIAIDFCPTINLFY